MYTYYSDGFFGYGPVGTFKPYTLMHFIPLLITIAAILFVWFKRDEIREWKYEARFRYILSFSMLCMELGFFVWLLYVGDDSGKAFMMSKLPLHLCDLGLLCCMFMVTSENKALFGINFFVTLFGATLVCIIPQTVLTQEGPMHFRYYQYFGEHLIPIFATVYMIIVHKMKPRYKDIWITVAVLTVMVIPSLYLNEAFPGSDYMFLRLDIPFMPESQYLRLPIYYLLLILIFHLMWFVWKRFCMASKKEK